MKELIDLIASVEIPNVFNPWRHSDPLDVEGFGPFVRRNRLRRHFECKPRFLLIGEAPGYQGCHFSGVAFTSERLLIEGVVPRASSTMGARFTKRPKPWSEPSATIVWGTLHALGIAEETVLWNAFAWHPHRPGEPMSNRTPTRGELLYGSEVLEAVVKHFESAEIVAVGQKSQGLLNSLGIRYRYGVRHPSMGGATQFRAELAEWVAHSKERKEWESLA